MWFEIRLGSVNSLGRTHTVMLVVSAGPLGTSFDVTVRYNRSSQLFLWPHQASPMTKTTHITRMRAACVDPSRWVLFVWADLDRVWAVAIGR